MKKYIIVISFLLFVYLSSTAITKDWIDPFSPIGFELTEIKNKIEILKEENRHLKHEIEMLKLDIILINQKIK